jgi:hypothetical protein
VVPDASGDYDVVFVAVRSDQLASACAGLAGLAGKPAIVLFGNNPAGRNERRYAGDVYLGFPGVGGVMSGGTAGYVRIRQPTALQQTSDPRLGALEAALSDRGFAVQWVADMDEWLAYHARSSRASQRPFSGAEPTPSDPVTRRCCAGTCGTRRSKAPASARSHRGVPMLKMTGGAPGAAGDDHDHCASAGYTPYAVRLKMTLSAPVSAGRANTS